MVFTNPVENRSTKLRGKNGVEKFSYNEEFYSLLVLIFIKPLKYLKAFHGNLAII